MKRLRLVGCALVGAMTVLPMGAFGQSAALYGPPLPTERLQAATLAQKLLRNLANGRLRMTNGNRDANQIRRVAEEGVYLWAAPTPEVLASGHPEMRVSRQAKPLPSRRLPTGRPSVPPIEEEPERDITPAEIAAMKADAPPQMPTQPSPELMQTLVRLSERATPQRPLEILSLFRPPYRTAYWRHGGPRTMHSQGKAVDIAAYGGYRIDLDRPEDCMQMTLALLRDLPPGRYRLGLPKAPPEPMEVGLPYPITPEVVLTATILATLSQPLADFPWTSLPKSETRTPWAFFPHPQPEMKNGVVAPASRNGRALRDAEGLPLPSIVRFQNSAYAEERDIHDGRIRKALAAARKRGVEIIAVFPDAADHLHLDLKSER